MKNTLNIIFVEENLHDAELIWKQIEKEQINFRRKLVGNKNDLIEAIESYNPDLIISGYMLTSLTGMEALSIRNDLSPATPFIFVTGLVNETVAVESMKAGADDYLMKRNLSRLGETIRAAIRKKEIVQQKNHAEKMLRESEEKYRAMVEHSPDAVLVHSWGKLLFANSTTLRMIGADSFDRIKNIDLFSFVHPDYRDDILSRIRRIYETGKAQGYIETKCLNLNKDVLDVEVIGLPVTYMGEPAIQTIARDIGSRKRAEEELIKAKEKAEESDQLKTAFLHNISHEIRTPMNAIVGFSALLNEPDLTPETQQTYLKVITDSSDQLLAIVNDIIEISNIEVGIIKATINEININSQLLELYQQFSHKVAEKGIGFKLHTSISGGRATIETDSAKLNRIIMNLLGNALKFTSRGNISFGYSLEGGFLEFFVSDTGIGIQEDQFERIFERFYQVESSASRAYEGTGLGLSITKAYVELLGGKIWLSSIPGKGSTFYFTLPYKKSEPQYISEMETTYKGPENQDTEKSVLIAEDDDNNFYLMKELLSDMNLRIIRASNGLEAVDAFNAGEKIDLVLMDIKMPVMDGYEATRQILEKSPEAKILAQTAYADDEIKAIESGCMGFISKPFVKDKFVSLVKEYL
ncbi:MAG TPA: response regulator [Bacteroidales bacterium]|nr:response regulator [Bacteroidales bacterium]